MWKDKVVIITGSSIGIGKQLALEIGRKGGKVILNARNRERLAEMNALLQIEGIDAGAFAGDIGNYNVCKELVDYTLLTYGRIDALINNAGISAQGTVEETNPDVFKALIDINLMGAFYLSHLSIPWLKKSSGSILFISSVAGIHGLGNHAAYSCSKMALAALAESLRIELHVSGVYVGIAHLGFTENDSRKTILNADGKLIPQPPRDNVQKIAAPKMAWHLMKMIENRNYRKVYSSLGKWCDRLNRFSPQLLHRLLLNVYIKRQY